MYEIWLIINTFYELALANLGLVLAMLIVWLVLMVIAAVKKAQPWKQGIKPALLVAAVVWVISFIMVPGLTRSSFANVTYIIDYMVVAGLALVCAGLAAAFVWPLYMLVRR